MYFTPRDAIKFKKSKQKNGATSNQVNMANISAAIYNSGRKQNLNNSAIAPTGYMPVASAYAPQNNQTTRRKIFQSVVTQPLDSQFNLSHMALD